MNAANRRLASAVSTLVWAGAILYFCLSGRIDLYLVPQFRNYAILGGLGLAVVSLFVLFTHRQKTGCGHHHDADGCDHNESGELPPIAILTAMLLPLLATSFLTKDSFSLQALTHKGAFKEAPKLIAPASNGGVPSRETLETSRPRNERGAIVLDLLEIVFSSMDAEYAANMDQLNVAIQGRVLSEKSSGAGSSIIYRLLLTCCAADGRPLSVKTRFATGVTPPAENTWAELQGTLSYEKSAQGVLTPVIFVNHLSEKSAPAEEYLLKY
jgi:uncharacterized repeat protein (TIGR03943 family)